MTPITGVKMMFKTFHLACVLYGWGGGIRTPECRHQKPMPYHLATPQYIMKRTKFALESELLFFLAEKHLFFFCILDARPILSYLGCLADGDTPVCIERCKAFT